MILNPIKEHLHIMYHVHGRIKGYHQCYKSVVTQLTTGCVTLHVVINLATNYV